MGHKKTGDDERHLKKVTSDTCFEYQNLSTSPFEVEKLMNTRIDSDDVGNFFIQLLSQPAMLQHIFSLKEIYKHKQFFHQYPNNFDAQLDAHAVYRKFSHPKFTGKLYQHRCAFEILMIT